MASSKNQEREAREARDRLKRYNARQAVHGHQVKRRRRDNLIAIIGIVVIGALAAGTQIFYFSAGPGATAASSSSSPSATPTPTASASASAEANVGDVPPVSVAEGRTWTGALTLNKTKLGISLDGRAAPQAVASFVTDAKTGYLTGKVCQRLLDEANGGFLQCGAIDLTGADASDYSFGPIENAPADQTYPAGTIAIARTGSAYGNGHQFFIVFKDTTLPNDTAGGYSVVGTVTSGLDALEKNITDAGIISGTTTSAGGGNPKTATTITSVTVK